MSFGEKLSQLRKQRGLSQEALAADLEISQSSISNYESGNQQLPNGAILEKIANYFEIPIEELFSQEKNIYYNYQNKNVNNSCQITNTQAYAEELIEQYKETIKLQKEQIELLKEQIELLKQK